MLKFLHSAAQFVLRQPRSLAESTVIVPSRRAGLFFLKALGEQSDQVLLAPRILSIEELLLEVSGLQIESQAALFFKCYESYIQSLEKAESFEDFNKWGRLLLQDFNEIDRHLVDPTALFEYVGDAKRIEHWELELGESESMAAEYLALWPKLALVYQHFKEQLVKDGAVYQGLAYRMFHKEVLQNHEALAQEYGHFIFIGFNALNKAEEASFIHLFEQGLADFYWDIDEYYWKNPQHEAGWFLRQSPLIHKLSKASKLYGIHQKLKDLERHLKIVAVSGKNLQTYIANQEMGQVPAEQQSETALVLADESLLPGVLNNLHPQVNSFNLSMGLSLKNSPLAGFFELLLEFCLEAERSNRKDQGGNQRFSHKRWNALLSHFILRRFSDSKTSILEACRQKLLDENALYRSLDELEIKKALAPIPVEIFDGSLKPLEIFEHLANFCLSFQKQVNQEKYLNEALYGFYQLFRQLKELLERYPYIQKFDQSLPFYRDLLADLSMDLRGEPLSGLQVMGMLESRTLDFKRLILTSLNEGVLPKGRSDNSLLPFDIKKKFGLPTYLEKDAVYAYHFYRLLHQAEEIVLLYSTSGGALGLSEPSRFIRQLKLEWPAHNRSLEIEEFNATGEAKVQENRLEEVPKSPGIIERLNEMAESGFSPTALIQYLKNPIDFYYERVLGLKPEDEIQEELEVPLQGTALHNCLEKYYSLPDPEDPELRIARSPAPDDVIFNKSSEEYRQDLLNELAELVPGAELHSGSNYLILETMTQMLLSFMQTEKKHWERNSDWQVEAVEGNLISEVYISGNRKINLKGQADRIDRKGEEVHVIDYKSGGKAKGDYTLSGKDFNYGLDDFIKKPYALQLPLYSYMYLKESEGSLAVKASILSLRKTKENPISMSLAGVKVFDQESSKLFEDCLIDLLEELFNPQIPFKKR